MAFREVSIRDINESAVKLIADEWMLVCAGDQNGHNMMTASWGFLGEMWGKDCAICAIRPQRHTLSFVEKNDTLALCFMGDRKDVHKVCGSLSGRDIDKTKETGLTPVFSDGTVYFEEARIVLICKKLYNNTINPKNFIEKDSLKWYAENDFHKMFVSEIVKVLVKE